MIPRECKRLAEVDFPIAEVSRQSAREKSIRHGHPSTLHLWWARRPLAACRAMLLALLLPDPADANCPVEFRVDARRALKPPLAQPRGQTDLDLRRALLKFIADFANWDAAGEPPFLEAARRLVQAAHGAEPPLVVDPFAGGGSIPLEALRLGCDAFASDLNPVACLILKVLLEEIPSHGPALAEELRRVGKEIKAQAEQELAEFYPPNVDGARPIAYLWARTVRCESSGCGAEIPLARSFWLAKKEVGRQSGKRVKLRGKQALRYTVDRRRGRVPTIVFEVFEPERDSEVPQGTVSRAKATCPACNIVMPPDRVRAQLAAQRGGADAIFDEQGERVGGARLLAVVTLADEERGRRYRLSSAEDYQAVWRAKQALEKRLCERLSGGLSLVPDEPLPPIGTLGFRVQRYGMLQWGDLFTGRQKLALMHLSELIRSKKFGGSLKELLALVTDRVASRGSSLSQWRFQPDQEKVEHVFTRQALPVMWDFAEAVLTSGSTGSFSDGVGVVAECVRAVSEFLSARGQVAQQDACHSALPSDTASVWFTDPPYYDAVPYADLADFFFVWLKRTLPDHVLLRDLFDPLNPLTPKEREAVQDESKASRGAPKNRAFFEELMAQAFEEGARVLREDGVGSVVFAHKTTEGWEALLSGLIRGGWVVTASWPITTEMATRLRARESAALSASVHLVCRTRGAGAGVGDWGEIFKILPMRVEDWMERLSTEGIRGADLVFACIGPALEPFSQYERVEMPDGEMVGLAGNPAARNEPAKRGYLSYVWEAVGRAALARVLGTDGGKPGNAGAGMLEEDARLTAIFLWTVQSTEVPDEEPTSGDEETGDAEDDDDEEGSAARRKSGLTLVYDVARRFAQPLGIHLDQWEGRIIDTDKGVVRLIPVRERARQLFGEEGAASVAERIEASARENRGAAQGNLFPELAATPRTGSLPRGRGGGPGRAGAAREPETRQDATTLDRVHAAMLLQSSGQATALRALLRHEIDRGPEFLRLANALSALYPKDGDEKRLLDAMLLAMPR